MMDFSWNGSALNLNTQVTNPKPWGNCRPQAYLHPFNKKYETMLVYGWFISNDLD